EEVQVSGADVDLIHLLVENKIAKSSSEVKRLLLQGAIEVDGKTINQPIFNVPQEGEILRFGKYKFLRIVQR
ncbi:hypothetical protein HYV21_01320, partial [Candidatus Microgenomates bacterium]|nr:hypothetical protein [Candidatus Microgenomates bacterium]